MSKEKIKVKVSLPEEAYTLIRAAACIYGLSPKAYLKMVATQCALEDLERLGRVIDAIGEEGDEDEDADDFEGCQCVCEDDCEVCEKVCEAVCEDKPEVEAEACEKCACDKKAPKGKKGKKA